MSKKTKSTKRKARKAAKAGQRAGKAEPAGAARSATRRKPGGKARRTSALDAAARVLEKAGKAMDCKALITAMAEQGLWTSPKGKTPHATLYAAMLREIGKKGAAARFKKVERGQFEFQG